MLQRPCLTHLERRDRSSGNLFLEGLGTAIAHRPGRSAKSKARRSLEKNPERMTHQEMTNQIVNLQVYRDRGTGVPQSLATDRQRGALRYLPTGKRHPEAPDLEPFRRWRGPMGH